MTTDVQRELAEALVADPVFNVDIQRGRFDSAGVILALLPTVQRLIADAEKRAAVATVAAATGRFADAEKQAEARALRKAAAAVRWVYDLQCPVRPATEYVDHGAYLAHKWWQTVLGGALDDLQARAAALESS